MKRIALTAIGSTNVEAQRLVAAGEVVGWTLVSAAEQTTGRGRLGRGWASPIGNAYTSFVVPKDGRAEWRRPWLIGFALALAIADTVGPLVEDEAEIRLKWPNDVLVGGGKISGILIESAGAHHLVAGIGVNVASHPDGTPYPATHIDRHRSRPVDLEAVIARLATAVHGRVETWLDCGFSAIRTDYLALSHRHGEALRVRNGAAETTEGRFVDLDADGLLLLDTGSGLARFSSGDVFPALRS